MIEGVFVHGYSRLSHKFVTKSDTFTPVIISIHDRKPHDVSYPRLYNHTITLCTSYPRTNKAGTVGSLAQSRCLGDRSALGGPVAHA